MATASPLAERSLGPLAVLVVLPVLLAAWTPVLPRLDFDVDPRVPGAATRVTLGAAGLGWLALWGTASAWASVAASVAAGLRLRRKSTVLVLAGTAAAAWHLPSTFDDAYHGVGWVWAASAGLAAAHLGRHDSARRWLPALPVALIVPLLFQAGWYRWVSHPATVEAYEAARAAGTWAGPGSDDPGGATARLYERRLRINDATGPFGFANVLGTVAAGLAVAAIATLPRPRGLAWWAGAMAAAAGVIVVLLTRSSGAAAALAAGVLVFATAWASAGWSPARVRGLALPGLALGLVFGVVAVVLVRGWMGAPPPEVGVAGERTLLFRSQYWAGAAELWIGGAAWLGLGPGGFGEAYARVKSELAPEAVTSTHNVLIDFAVMLGLGGLAWAGVLLGWLATAARAPGERPDDAEAAPAAVTRPELYAVFGVAVVLFGFEAWVRLAELATPELTGRGLAAAGFVAAGLAVRRAGARGAAFASLGSAVAVLVHGQLDMGFHLPAAAPLLWLLVGLAAGAARPRRPATPPRNILPPAFVVGVAGVVSVGTVCVGLTRLSSHASSLADAAAAARAGDAAAAIAALDVAAAAVGRDRVAEAAAIRTLFEVAVQAEGAGRTDAALNLYAAAAERAMPTQPAAAGEAHARRADLLEVAGVVPAAVDAERAAAVDAFEAAVATSPTRPERWVRLGRARAEAGDGAQAEAAYAEALRLDDLLYLDPDTRMRAAERSTLVRTLRDGVSEPPS